MDTIVNIQYQCRSCLLGGAIGDAWGSSYENEAPPAYSNTFYLVPPKEIPPTWTFTDDTQLTMATCETLCMPGAFEAGQLADRMLQYYLAGKLTGIGASTLKAINELREGGHWSQVGRGGEFAAGNGAAMRIAPFAFFSNITREDIRNACRITHRNDEAYVGALAIVLCLKSIISGAWNGDNNLFDLIIPELPDTRVRDRLIEINAIGNTEIAAVARLGCDGYVVNSVPLAIFAAKQAPKLGILQMFQSLMEVGGDTDTNASMAGQIAGALIGLDNYPRKLVQQLEEVSGYNWVKPIIDNTAPHCSHS
ncbi:ADP-ribosylglycohydrolase family protein [Paraflavitalea sp. CAU 1676]|uniref:ADP-ribosylglycohydrolase family protein n=1 Tax=Paraflavitalea sp. CAU 1676 TaxID=3032598 RepID=UPI0023DA07C7|nr:ADP-ribosylglycohydrolase family protein [Paraflavitalea sp. CAU 1676]MDF2188521.1 ADP-ribosylglycohydrolase family protein [Paraflavitalea sp. CAU 1676]